MIICYKIIIKDNYLITINYEFFLRFPNLYNQNNDYTQKTHVQMFYLLSKKKKKKKY